MIEECIHMMIVFFKKNKNNDSYQVIIEHVHKFPLFQMLCMGTKKLLFAY